MSVITGCWVSSKKYYMLYVVLHIIIDMWLAARSLCLLASSTAGVTSSWLGALALVPLCHWPLATGAGAASR
jgi:hypothetical protein